MTWLRGEDGHGYHEWYIHIHERYIVRTSGILSRHWIIRRRQDGVWAPPPPPVGHAHGGPTLVGCRCTDLIGNDRYYPTKEDAMHAADVMMTEEEK